MDTSFNYQLHPPKDFISFSYDEIKNSIISRFEQVVKQSSCKIALQIDGISYTYEAFNHIVNNIARVLLKDKHAHRPIALLLNCSLLSIAALFAILKLARFFIVIDSDLPTIRIESILQNSKADTIIADNSTIDLTKKLSKYCEIINIEEIDLYSEAENIRLLIPPETLSYIIYTSGSTGSPKGVFHDHKNVLHQCLRVTNTFFISPSDRLILLSSLSTAQAMTIIFSALLNGATLYPVNIKKIGLSNLASFLNSEQITIYHSSASVFRYFVNTLQGQETFSTLRLIRLGGETVVPNDIDLFKKYFPTHCSFVNVMSSSETGTIRKWIYKCQKPHDFPMLPVGSEVYDMQIILLDDFGKEVALGEIGEIAVISPYLFLGYFNDSDLTRKFLTKSESNVSIYRTGDLGKIDDNGMLYHLGRKDFQVKIRGFKVELSEIEIVLRSMREINQVVVMTQEEDLDLRLVAYLSLNEGLPNHIIRQRLSKKLPSHMIPSFFIEVDHFPLTQSGKINRQELKTLFEQKKLTTQKVASDQFEMKLITIWQEVLNIDSIHLTDNFFNLGGHSLLSLQLIDAVEKALDKKLPLEAIYPLSTVQAMADSIRYEYQDRLEMSQENKTLLQPAHYRRLLSQIAGIKDDSISKSLMIRMNPKGRKKGLYWGVNSWNEAKSFAMQLGEDQPFFGLLTGRMVLQDHKDEGFLKALAQHYLEEILKTDSGPYFLGGYCAGSRLAIEIALLLKAQNKIIEKLCLLEFFDQRLFDYEGEMLLLYGDRGNEEYRKAFNWQDEGWEQLFKTKPQVDLIPGDHHTFLSLQSLTVLGEKVSYFLMS